MVKSRSKGPAKLPAKQLAILAICRFAEPLALTSVFPYLPEMIESFGVEKKDVAKWAGITSAVFSLSQCTTAILWGRASDRFGRKSAILTGLTCTLFCTLLWGLSTTLPMAILARALTGAMNGNVGIIRTMVAEMVPEKELQPRAFSIMPLVWSIGSIFGPSFGGAFAKPATNYPGLFGNSWFLNKFPFALPNLIASIFFLTGITTGILFLRETLETKRHTPDYGIKAGKKLVAFFKSVFRLYPKPKHYRRFSAAGDDPTASLLRPTSAAGSSRSFKHGYGIKNPPKPALPRPTLSEVFTRQSVINIVAYTFLALHSIAYDQLLPVFMHHTKQTPDSSNTRLPFKFSGGFGLASGRIGTIFTLYGILGGFVQFLIFPPTARRFGVLNCFKGCAILYPTIFFVTPYTALIQNSSVQQAAMFGIMVFKCVAGIFSFPCSVILMTNSAASLRILGTLNGVAVSVSGIGRAIGPALGGAAFTWGLERGYVITPWWVLGTIAILGAIPIWYLEEMGGFSGADDASDDEEEDGLPDAIEEDVNREILEGDEILAAYNGDEEALDIVEGPPLSRLNSRNSGSTRNHGYGSFESRMSSPIGMREPVGPGGGRRFSNGLAASNLGQGTGGTSFSSPA